MALEVCQIEPVEIMHPPTPEDQQTLRAKAGIIIQTIEPSTVEGQVVTINVPLVEIEGDKYTATAYPLGGGVVYRYRRQTSVDKVVNGIVNFVRRRRGMSNNESGKPERFTIREEENNIVPIGIIYKQYVLAGGRLLVERKMNASYFVGDRSVKQG